MPKRVICISRTLGAGGERIAHDVAARLGYRYIDEEIIAIAAEKAGVSHAQIEKAEHSQPLVARILETLAATPMVTDSGYIAPPIPTAPAPAYSSLIEHVIRETADAGDVVIVAHGASHPLSGRPDVLRVLVTAPPEARTDRVAEENKLDAPGARKAIEASDRERAKYLQRFYKVPNELPTHYDLTINTEAVTVSTATGVIAAACAD